MATENKRINTRILLKYDTYANWISNDPKLLAGEVAIATIDSGDTQKVNSVSVPQVLIKVGDGSKTYSALPFVSGLAADVYSWAKAANKPSYAIHEITGAKEYTVVKGANEYEWKLQARAAGSTGDYTDVASINLSEIATRIGEVESRVTTAEGKITSLEGKVGDETKGLVKDVADLKAAVGEGGSVSDIVDNKINSLDTPDGGVSQAAGADGLALNVVQENGIVTSISGSIAANTYDAYGSAKAAVEALDATVSHAAGTDGLAIEITQVDGKLTGVTASIAAETYDAYGAAKAAVEALDYTGATGDAEVQAGTEVKFIKQVTQENGTVEAELGSIQFQSALSADNKAATMSDITDTLANISGAMRFKGVKDSVPTDNSDYINGDVIIVGTKEHVFDGTKWVELGDETTAGTLIAGITGNSTGAVSKTVTAHTQANGVVTLTYKDIAIAESQVAGLTDKLATMQGEIDAEEERAAAAEKANADAINVIEGSDEGKSMREVAQAVATAGLTAITNASIVAPSAAQTIKLIKQTNGVVEATAQDIHIAESQVTGLTEALAAKATNTDLETAKGRIKANEDAIAKLNDADTVVGSVANSIQTAIEGLDKADTAVEGQFVTAVSEENGVITVSRGTVNVKDLEQTADTYVVFDCGTSSTNI